MSFRYRQDGDAGYFGNHGVINIESLNINFLSTEQAGDFTTTLTRPITDIRKLTLEQVIIPFTFTTIQSADKIPFVEGANPEILIQMPVSSPTFTELATIIGNLLTANSPGGSTYTCTYSDSTGKFTITNSLNLLFTFNWDSQLNVNKNNNSWQLLGANNLIWNHTQPQASTWISPGVVLLNPGSLYITILPVSSNITSLLKRNTTFIIPINGNFQDLIIWERNAGDEQSIYFNSKGFNLNRFEVQIKNFYGDILEIPGYVKILVSYDTWPENN